MNPGLSGPEIEDVTTTMLKRKEFILGAAAGLTIAAAATAGGVINWPGAQAQVAGVSGHIAPTAGASGLAFAPPQGAPLSFADIFDQVAPAVVQIEVKTPVERPQGGVFAIPGLPGFGFRAPPGAQTDPDAEPELAAGAGSGFFISADGFIVTNNHVVANATEITVKLADGRELEAELIGRDPGTDLAVLKVEGSDFPFVSFEEAAEPRVGDWVLAVGNPFALGGTATAGIVSAKARDIDPNGYNDFIQIDAAINTGNSGGPTFDIYGRVIGVNSVILSPSRGSVGIGFAIPAAIAKTVTDQLMRGQTVQRGYLGIGIRTFTPEQWEASGESEDFEAGYVESVTAGGPAETGGVEVGDYIVAVNGEPVENGGEVTRLVGNSPPGDVIRLNVIRQGRRQSLNVRAGTRPPEDELNAQDQQNSGGSPVEPRGLVGEAVEGMSVAPLTAGLRERYSIPDTVSGLIVTRTNTASGSQGRALPVGTVITRAANRPVPTADALRQAIASARTAGRSGILLFIRTPEGSGPVIFPLPDPE